MRRDSSMASELQGIQNPALAEIRGRAGGSPDMLSQCANSQCSKPFLRLREGKLFLVETDRLPKPGESVSPPFVRARQQQRHVEHYRLCNECAARYTLIYDHDHGVALAALQRPAATMAVAAGAACTSSL